MTRSALRRARSLALACVLALLLAVAGAGTVTAHAVLVSTDPPDGATLGGAPHAVRIVFSEPVAVDLTAVSLVDGTAHAVPGIAVAPDPTNEAAILVRLPELSPDAYRIDWRTVDRSDLHVTSGSLVFGIGRAAPPAAPQPVAVPGTLEVVTRWLEMLSLALLAGAFAVLALALPRRRPAPDAANAANHARQGIVRALLGLAAAGAAGAMVAGAVLLVLQTTAAGTAFPLQSVLGTDYGIAWSFREAVLAGMLVLALAHLRRLRGAVALSGLFGPRPGLIALALVALGLAGAFAGHVSSGAPGERPLRIAALTAHLVAAWAWTGGLLVLSIVVLPRLRRGEHEADLARAVLRRFWRIAAPGLAVMAVTGLYLGGQLVASVDALLTTLYGQTLLVKVSLALAVSLLGLVNAARLHPRVARAVARALPVLTRRDAAPRPMRRTIVAESIGALAIVLAASILSASPPARGPVFDPVPEATPQADLATRLDDLFVTMSLRPGRPGPNFLDLGLYETRRPAPAPIDQVTVRLVSPDGASGPDLVARSLGGSRFEIADGSITTAGSWRIAVSVHRTGMQVSRLDVPWAVQPEPPAGRRVLVSDRPLAPIASIAALLLGLLFAAVLIVAALRRVSPRLGVGAAPSISAADAVGRGGGRS